MRTLLKRIEALIRSCGLAFVRGRELAIFKISRWGELDFELFTINFTLIKKKSWGKGAWAETGKSKSRPNVLVTAT